MLKIAKRFGTDLLFTSAFLITFINRGNNNIFKATLVSFKNVMHDIDHLNFSPCQGLHKEQNKTS